LARQNGWEGTTLVRVEILTDGLTGMVEVVGSSGHRVLDEAAVEAVRAARFEPARLEGVPTVCWVEVPITFRLNRG
jgi:protein TonB